MLTCASSFLEWKQSWSPIRGILAAESSMMPVWSSTVMHVNNPKPHDATAVTLSLCSSSHRTPRQGTAGHSAHTKGISALPPSDPTPRPFTQSYGAGVNILQSLNLQTCPTCLPVHTSSDPPTPPPKSTAKLPDTNTVTRHQIRSTLATNCEAAPATHALPAQPVRSNGRHRSQNPPDVCAQLFLCTPECGHSHSMPCPLHWQSRRCDCSHSWHRLHHPPPPPR